MVISSSAAPCVPRNPVGHLDCVSNAAWVSWDEAEGAHSYFAFAEGTNGHNSSCTVASSPCEVPDLMCGTHYTFYVTATNEHCNSNYSTTFDLETGVLTIFEMSLLS